MNPKDIIQKYKKQNITLHKKHVNPQFARVLEIIEFDKAYIRAKGAYLWDENQNQYLDMLAGYGVWNIGRNHPKMRQTLKQFLDEEYPSLIQMEAPLLSGVLAQELKKHVGYQLDIVYFTSTGAEAIETAIKCARAKTKKQNILYLENAFHGLTNGALSVNANDEFKTPFEPLNPATKKIPFGNLNALEEELKKNNSAAFILEPIQGKGVYIHPPQYIQNASQLCQKYQTLLIIDEVQTGFGRSGKFLAIHHEKNVKPDIITISKSLSGGYIPVGAVLMKKNIYDSVFQSLEKAVIHSSTFGQGAIAMMAGLAAIEILEEENLMQNATERGKQIAHGLNQIKNQFEFIKEIRQKGLMIGIEFGQPKSFKLKTAWKTVNALSQDLFCQAVIIPLMKEHRILTQVAGNQSKIIKLIPPLCISEHDVDYFLQAFTQVMHKCHKFPGALWENIFQLAKKTAITKAKKT